MSMNLVTRDSPDFDPLRAAMAGKPTPGMWIDILSEISSVDWGDARLADMKIGKTTEMVIYIRDSREDESIYVGSRRDGKTMWRSLLRSMMALYR
jgi:hypothetical protein